jgi:hypothetical protein
MRVISASTLRLIAGEIAASVAAEVSEAMPDDDLGLCDTPAKAYSRAVSRWPKTKNPRPVRSRVKI